MIPKRAFWFVAGVGAGVACSRTTWPMIAETVTRIATETGILK